MERTYKFNIFRWEHLAFWRTMKTFCGDFMKFSSFFLHFFLIFFLIKYLRKDKQQKCYINLHLKIRNDLKLINIANKSITSLLKNLKNCLNPITSEKKLSVFRFVCCLNFVKTAAGWLVCHRHTYTEQLMRNKSYM